MPGRLSSESEDLAKSETGIFSNSLIVKNGSKARSFVVLSMPTPVSVSGSARNRPVLCIVERRDVALSSVALAVSMMNLSPSGMASRASRPRLSIAFSELIGVGVRAPQPVPEHSLQNDLSPACDSTVRKPPLRVCWRPAFGLSAWWREKASRCVVSEAARLRPASPYPSPAPFGSARADRASSLFGDRPYPVRQPPGSVDC